jgi:DNA ligase (NAD+)
MQPVEHCKGEVYWYCVNAACPAQLNRNLDHFVSKGAMDIVGMGTKIVEQLTDAGLVHDVADIYQLKRADFLRLEGFADKKADNLISAIMSSKGQSLARLINALGIRGVGEVVARDLANAFHSLDQLSQLTVVELQMVEGIGPNIAQAIVDWFNRPMNRNVLMKLQASGVWPQQGSTPANTSNVQTLADYIFVVTGTFVSFSREDVKKYIEDRGGIFSESVSKKTSFLVLGENPGSKLEKARSLDIKIIDEVALRKLGG